jgi:dipeptidyl-peptidase-3
LLRWVAGCVLAMGCGQPHGTTPATTANPGVSATTSAAANKSDTAFKVLAESFGDISILRYRVPGFEELPLNLKKLAFHMSEAALAGRDIIYDQKYKYNLAVRRTLEAVVTSYKGDKKDPEYAKLVEYTKLVWVARGVHHDYSSQKYVPGFGKESFAKFVKGADPKRLPLEQGPDASKKRDVEGLIAFLTPILFDPKVAPMRVDRSRGVDVIQASSNNFYEGVTQQEVEDFYKAKIDKKDERPVSWGLNSKLVKVDGKLVEQPWKIGGMYSAAIEKIIFHLDKALALAENDKQKAALSKLIAYYKSGELKDFDDYNVAWVADTDSRMDLINGFIETYGDALGYRATWESVVQMRDLVRTKRIATIGKAAQWFEDNSPIDKKHKKDKVVGISAKVVTVVMEGGDTSPTTPIGINLPNSNWIRKEHGSKSVFLGNIVDAYQEVKKDSGVLEEFTLSKEAVARAKAHGAQGYALKVDMHEVIGHASGQLEPGVGTTKETLKTYASALEEARADLVALYFVMDSKLIELGVMKSLDVGKAAYDGYIRGGLMVQLARIKPGDEIVQSHMRNRQMVCAWAYERGKKDNVIERVEKDGNIYFVIHDYDKLRTIWGELLKEVQRIKSRGDFEAGKKLIEDYGVKVDKTVHDNVLTRYKKLGVKPYSAFIQPKLVPVMKDGKISDVEVTYPADFMAQMLEYSAKYSHLPTYN